MDPGLTSLLLLLLGALPFAALWMRARRRATAERAGRDLLLDVMEATPAHFALYDADRRLLAFNRAYRELHTHLPENPIGRVRYDDLLRLTIARTLPPEQVEAEVARRVATHESGIGESFDRVYPDGRWMRVSKQRLRNGAVAGFALDVTPLKAREAALAASEARYRVMVDDAPVGIWHLDAEGSTIFANAVLAALFDGAAPPALGSAGLILPPEQEPEHPFGFVPGRRMEVALPGHAHAPRTLLVTASPWISDAAGGRSALLTLLDITSLKRAQAQVEHLARHDPLTGLANRDAFRTALSALVEGGGALILLDLDHFKETNDRHGHEAGDAVLMAIGDRLRAAVRLTDGVCRLGGDEFALVVHGMNAKAAEELARRVTRLAAEPVSFRGAQLRVGASAGIAMAPEDGDDPDALNRAADLALYQSKAERGGWRHRLHARRHR
jgi:diguanylate cyclase (GGDEF)-like protein